jgi:hypothetical protein
MAKFQFGLIVRHSKFVISRPMAEQLREPNAFVNVEGCMRPCAWDEHLKRSILVSHSVSASQWAWKDTVTLHMRLTGKLSYDIATNLCALPSSLERRLIAKRNR